MPRRSGAAAEAGHQIPPSDSKMTRQKLQLRAWVRCWVAPIPTLFRRIIFCTTAFMLELKFVYVLRSISDSARHYVGLTCDIASRLAAHNAGHSPHTARSKPWRVVVSLEFGRSGHCSAIRAISKVGFRSCFRKAPFRLIHDSHHRRWTGPDEAG